ncbi:hypothetical protein CDL15_Pgr025452 [Punica granatum]|uniref:Uncharacterized protein n=1 Tax=Punica granatum TaxID=22663 RepID=A0A218W901_PUNGR|nr:hypothetical protein CDL15_Pgr025452 [Punica granatum]
MSSDSISSSSHGNVDEQISQLMQCKPLSEQEVPSKSLYPFRFLDLSEGSASICGIFIDLFPVRVLCEKAKEILMVESNVQWLDLILLSKVVLIMVRFGVKLRFTTFVASGILEPVPENRSRNK